MILRVMKIACTIDIKHNSLPFFHTGCLFGSVLLLYQANRFSLYSVTKRKGILLCKHSSAIFNCIYVQLLHSHRFSHATIWVALNAVVCATSNKSKLVCSFPGTAKHDCLRSTHRMQTTCASVQSSSDYAFQTNASSALM